MPLIKKIHNKWMEFRNGFKCNNDLRLVRHKFKQNRTVFADAFERANCAAAYVRSINKTGRVIDLLLYAKSIATLFMRPTISRLCSCGVGRISHTYLIY